MKYIYFSLQIKIWFQNRRTKWKRKYTSDVESLASHYYSQLGIGFARPMVVGDRLWVFSQPPGAPPTPVQSVLLNNPAPPILSPSRPGDIFDATRTALLSRGQNPYVNKHLFHNRYISTIPKPGHSFSSPHSHHHPHQIYPPYGGTNKYHIPTSPTSFVAASTSDSGIKELERVFGNPEVIVSNGINSITTAIKDKGDEIFNDHQRKEETVDLEDMEKISHKSSEINCDSFDEEEDVEL